MRIEREELNGVPCEGNQREAPGQSSVIFTL